jgi:mono/diheme cytochrome c family protein
MKHKIQFGVFALALMATVAVFALREINVLAQKPLDFNRDVRPILSDNCFACHGPDENQRKARLRLDTKDGAFAKQGVIVAGKSAESRLYKRIAATDPNTVMPPVASGHKLTPQQIETIKRWIDDGANWTEHWAFVAPKRPELPSVKDTTWVRNGIDNFILARLEKEKLKPSPVADKTTLLRRVTLDLTGLPPTPKEVDDFLADKAPNAYEKLVDRLLASPHYGERFAMYWLDIARYADTHGYHIDSHREMWPWRDWAIKAFNQNKPYDQFIVEQLAGDLLPNATTEQKIASGFNRNHMINFEGGAIPDEYLTEYVIDRVETTSNAFMALTLGCARCHSHKYDPISQKEFYQFYAFFNSVNEVGLDGRDGNAKPFLSLPTNEQKAKQTELAAAIKVKEKLVAEKEVEPLQSEWEKRFVGKVAEAPRDGLVAHYEMDGSFADIAGGYKHARRLQGSPDFAAGKIGRAASFDGDSQVTFGKLGPAEKSDSFSLAMWLRGNTNLPITLLQKLENETLRKGFEVTLDGYQLIGIQRRAPHINIHLTANAADNAIHVRSKELIRIVDWGHVVVSYDGSGKAAGIKLYFNGKPAELEIIKDNLASSIANDAELQIGNKAFGRPYKGQLDDLRFYNRPLNEQEIEQLAIHLPVQTYLSGVYGQRSKEEAAAVREYFLTYAAPENLRAEYTSLNDLKKQKADLDKAILNTMVMDEMSKPRETFVLARGDYRNKTDKVSAAVPAVLPPLPSGAKANRLGLAKWLVDPSHPLTARVAVNRFWQLFFGLGIVKTSEDFGAQGEPPVHAELLDWLATEFMNADWGLRNADLKKTISAANPQSAIQTPQSWDVKALHKLIVTSATYRQASKVTPEVREKDPENRLLARGARFRLQAELIRDNALAVSGLLNDEIGGKSVFPYQPVDLWDELAFGDGFTAQKYTPSSGQDLYRRSMYTFWKRTVPPAALNTFDAPDREKCVARRPVTNTPLQALITMNDPTYIEAARVLAQKAMQSGGADMNSRLTFAFRQATSRKPTPEELSVLRNVYIQHLASYRKDAKAAAALLSIGASKADAKLNKTELAAWTMVVSAILNLDETITKE